MQQLTAFGKEFEALKTIKTDLVAVSTDDRAAATELKRNKDGVLFPMPLLSDPEPRPVQAIPDSRRLREPAAPRHIPDRRERSSPLPALSSEPFLDSDFIKAEAARVNRLLDRPADAASREPLIIREAFIRD